MAKDKVVTVLKKQALLIILTLVVLTFGLLSSRFFTLNNLLMILKQVALVGVLTIGMTYIVIGGNMDLSMGSIVSLTTVIVVRLHDSLGALPAVAVALIVGMAFGSITGFLVGYVHLNGMITSLALQSIIYSVALIYTGNTYFRVENESQTGTWFSMIGRGNIYGIPTQIIIYAVLIAIFQVILSKTLYGKRLVAVGNNSLCASYSGINSNHVVFRTYVISGLCAAITGIIMTSRSMSGQCDAGTGMEFDALTATILGGTSLAGGSGNIVRSFLGVLIIGMLKNGFIMLGLNDRLQWILQCVIIIVVVWVDMSSKRRVSR